MILHSLAQVGSMDDYTVDVQDLKRDFDYRNKRMRTRTSEVPETMTERVKELKLKWDTKDSEGWTKKMPDKYIEC